MNVATFQLTLALPLDDAPISSMLAFLEETVGIDETDLLGVRRIGNRMSDHFELPLFEVTVTEDVIPAVAEWFNRTVESFEVDFAVEWRTVTW